MTTNLIRVRSSDDVISANRLVLPFYPMQTMINCVAMPNAFCGILCHGNLYLMFEYTHIHIDVNNFINYDTYAIYLFKHITYRRAPLHIPRTHTQSRTQLFTCTHLQPLTDIVTCRYICLRRSGWLP